MKQTLSRWAVLAAGATGLLVSSCAYDPYYDGGYGYSGGSYSSSVFISTGDSRWGYDPYCNSYYDYTRRAYYDPFLYGYYPVGYRPPLVYGVPHPHGWRPGMNHCPPPSRVRSYNLSNYRDREGAYRRGNFSWSREVRQRDQGSNFNPRDRDNRSRDGNDSRRDFTRERDDNRLVRRDFPGQQQQQQQRPSFDRDRSSERSRENLLQQRREFEQQRSRESERSRQIERSRESDRTRGNFDRSQLQNRSRESRPSTVPNNPVTIPTPRSEPQRETPRLDRGAEMRQRFEQQRGGGESRQRSENQGRSFRGGSGSDGENSGERRGRR